MNMTQDATTQEKEITETVIDGITVRLSFSDSGSDEIPKLVKDILKSAYLRCQAQ